MKISDIKQNPNNPRVIKDDRYKKLKRSIEEFPKMMKLRPMVVNEENIVLGGNMRLKALKEIGYKEIPDEWIKHADELTEDEQRRFIIVDNVGFGDNDWEMLQAEWDVSELEEWGVEVPDWASGEEKEAEDDNFDTPDENEIETDIVLGDVFEIGNHRLLCGDATDSDQVAKLMNGELADMVFTDPPYGVAYVGKTKDKLTIESDNIDSEKLKEYTKAWFNNIDLFTRNGAYILATVPPGPLHLIFAQDWVERSWLRQIMVWNKSSMVLGHSEYHYKHEPILFGWKPGGERIKNADRTKTTVWDFDKPNASREHPTKKPVEMSAYGIKNHSLQKNIIFEPFLGSGTTMVACEQLNRKCYGMEIAPKYCQVIIDRMKKLNPELTIKKNGTIQN